MPDLPAPSPRVDRFLFDLLTGLDEVHASMTEIRIFILLSQSTEPISMRSIARQINRDRATVRAMLEKMRAAGFVTDTDTGFALTRSGETERRRLAALARENLSDRCLEALRLVDGSGLY